MKKKEFNMAAPKTVLVGDRVRYESAAGTIRGEVVAIEERLCADNIIRPWIVVEHIVNNRPVRTSLADKSLAMMKFKVIFRDVDIQIARSEKAIEDSWARNPDRSGGQYSDAEILESLNRW